MTDRFAAAHVEPVRAAERDGEPRASAAGGARPRWLTAVLLVLSAVGLVTFALTVAARAPFPWPLEWMEGASLQHALRLLRGQALYAAPNAEFIPYLYPPLAYVPMAVSTALFGASLPAARLTAIACSAGTIALIGRATARTAGAQSAGWAAAGLFAVGFGYTGAFLDLARVDAAFVLLLAAAAERVLAGRERAALACLALSAFAKQHGVILLVALSLALLARDPRRAARDVAVSWIALIALFCALELATGGWFSRYTLALPATHGAEPALLASFFAVDVLLYLPVLAIAAALELPRVPRAFAALLVAALLASALGRAHPGGHDNVRLPAFALLCIAGVVPLARALLSPARSTRSRLALCAALVAQFALLWQAPSFHAPPARSAERFAALRAALERCARGGRAVALDHALLTGRPFMHTMALSDLRMGHDQELARAGSEALLAALRAPDGPAAVAVGERFPALERVLAERYRPCAELPAPPLATGYAPGLKRAHGKVQTVYTRADLRATADAGRARAVPSGAGTR